MKIASSPSSSWSIHRSEIFRGSGDLEQAEKEARRAHELFSRAPYQPAIGHALYQLAEVQRLRGEFDEAEATFRQGSACGIDPQPGLALLRLAQRDSEIAAASLRRLAAEAVEAPQRIRLLPALVYLMMAVDDLDAATAAVKKLAELAETYPTDALKARVAYARGVLALGRSEPGLALDNLRRALATWQSLRTPFEVARTRLSIAQACRLLGDEETAVLEQGAAGQILDDIGVARLTAVASARFDDGPRLVGAGGRGPAPPRQRRHQQGDRRGVAPVDPDG